MKRTLPLFFHWSLMAVIISSLSACDYRATTNGNNKVKLSGIVQKGLFTNLQLEAYVIDDATGNKGALLPVVVTDQQYSVQLDPDQTLLLEARGTFVNDVNGNAITLDEPLKVIVDVQSQNKTANINLLTTLVAQRVINTLSNDNSLDILQGLQNPIDALVGLQSDSPPIPTSELISQQEGIVNSLFGLAKETEPDQLDYRNIKTGMNITDPNVQLLLISAGVTKNITGDELFSGGFDKIVEDVVNVPSNATESNTLVPALVVLDNLDATNVYADVKTYSNYTYLPEVAFADSPVFNCVANRSCGWSTQESSTIRVSSDPTYEAEGRLKLIVSLGSPSLLLPTKVQLSTESSEAIDGIDYLGIDEVITFSAGQTTKAVYVDLVIDHLSEQSETFNLNIKSLSRRYSVEQDLIALSILDGFQAGFEDQDSTNINIDSLTADIVLCVSGSCAPLSDSILQSTIDGLNNTFGSGLTFDPDASVGLINGNNQLLDVKIDISCDENQNCPSISSGLLVSYYLVAKDSSKVQQLELSLGEFLYVKNVSDEYIPGTSFVELSGPAVNTLAINAKQNGWDLEIEARLKSPIITSSVPIKSLVPLPPSVVLKDGTKVLLSSVLGVSDAVTANCSSEEIGILGIYQLPNEYHVSLISGGSFSDAIGLFCVELDSDNPIGTPATAVDGKLDILGLTLPDGMSWRADGTNAGLPIISPFIQLALPHLSFYLHAEGWPFEFEIDKAYVSFRGLEISYSDMRYIGSVGYSDQDPRKNNALFSNDIYYSGVKGQSGILQLKPEGVSGDFNVQNNQTSSKNTAYPRATIQWQGFSQSIINNKLQSAKVNVSNYQLKQSTECSESGCANDIPQLWQVTASNVKLDGDGFMLGNAVNKTTNQKVVFGALSSGGFAWSRLEDLTNQQNMNLASPGYVIPATERVSDYLIAHLNEDENNEKIIRYPLGSDSFVDGNYHPVGLSMGPEIYRNATDGTPVKGDGQDLSTFNNKLTINNGVDAPFNLTSSVAVKYVLRNSGLTGVFNVSAVNLSNANFYGYPLNLSRFAVRATDNKLDDYTWIDGRLALQGDAGGTEGLDIWFSNLEMNCAARLGNVDLLSEACDGIDNNDNGITDENCSPRLHSWKADTDIFAAKFDGADGSQACKTGDQDFVLDQQLHFKALNKPVVFETKWDVDGNLVGQTSGELPKYRFDKSAEGKGFPIKTKGAKLGVGQVDNDGYGWLELEKTKLGVSFWNAFDADLQIANSLKPSGIVAEPTIAVQANTLKALKNLYSGEVSNKDLLRALKAENIDDNKAGAFDIAAKYQWGRTGFGFELPVYYQPHQLDSGNGDEDTQGRQSRFLGRTLSKDLFVMDANAGINFVEPERTKLSFGASADFERLGNISFQVDLSDPGSVAEVDDLLLSVNIINSPILEPALEGLLGQVDIVNRFASRGLDEVVKEGLELVIKTAGQASENADPFVLVSDALAKARSGPQQAITVIVDEIKKPLNNQLFSLEALLRGEITKIRGKVNQAPNYPKGEVLESIDILLSKLKDVVKQANAVKATINGTVNRATGLISEAKSSLSDVTGAVNGIDVIIRDSVSFQSDVCSNSSFPTDQANNELGYLDSISLRFSKVRELIQTIKGGDEIFAVIETLVDGSEQERRLDTSKRRIREAVTELLDFVETADKAVRNIVCDDAKVGEVIAKVEKLTDRIRKGANDAVVFLNNSSTAIIELTALSNLLITEIENPINGLSMTLESVREKVDEVDISTEDLLTEIDNAERKIMSVFASAKNSINTSIDTAEVKLKASLSNVLPGAYMSPDQLREMLVTEVMRSGPIKEMRLVMDKHFAEIGSTVNNIVLQYLDQLNFVIKDALAAVTGPVNDALAEATSSIRGIGLNSAGIDGFAVIAGKELERAHIGAEWSMGDDDPTEFKAALDAVSWSAKNSKDKDNDNPTSCGAGDASSLLDVTISAYGLPINILSSDIEIEKVYLGFTLESNEGSGPALTPIGIFGGISTMGQIVFTDAKVIDPGFVAGLGELQTYIGAKAAASFSNLEAEVAFLVGRVCPGNSALTELDPDVAKFLPSMPPTGFAGAYLRGGVTIPIVNPGSCFLNLGVSADFGTWIFIGEPTTIGGLVGGGAVGQVMCIASIKGKVRVAGSVNTDGGLKLAGDAWGVAGLGFCEPETWTSVKRSRDDSWCGTGDIETGAVFENGSWEISVPTPSGIH